MIVRRAVFITSSIGLAGCPEPNVPEYAFIGRSNVGKSSFINMLTGQKNLARTSSRPGKTQTIQHYLINDAWYLVDLPGIGFARISKSRREEWQKMIASYLLKRTSLMNTFVLVDSRLEPQSVDIELVNWLGGNRIPFVILFTKTDKASQSVVSANIKAFCQALAETWEVLPPYYLTSAQTGLGKKEILGLINETNPIFSKP